ncbi:terpenoid cyclases/protein prenyltransferase alpha-alpha toroid [Chytridium lagenaria]|nr:terpenoid cyclases/protein prenyltransferase alpha-alpha toroid [Chytridium lagenaria]
MTLAFFGLSGLDLLQALDEEIGAETKRGWIEWIYAQQVHPDPNDSESIKLCGFRGSPASGRPYEPNATESIRKPYDCAQLAMTYTALATLVILGDDLSRVDRTSITAALKGLQNPEGVFKASFYSSEADMRYLFTACAVSYFINDFSGIDKDLAVSFILRSQNYDYGFGQGVDTESHGGVTYCALAALALMGRLDAIDFCKEKTINWLLQRQASGFTGRVGKTPDTCYSFWVGASLAILGAYGFCQRQREQTIPIHNIDS